MSKTDTKSVVKSMVETETLVALATSNSVTEAAKKLGISRFTIYERIHKYELADQLKNIQQAALIELVSGASKAAKNLVDKVDHVDPDVSMKSSTEILDRVGITKPVNNAGNTINNFGTILTQLKDKYSD